MKNSRGEQYFFVEKASPLHKSHTHTQDPFSKFPFSQHVPQPTRKAARPKLVAEGTAGMASEAAEVLKCVFLHFLRSIYPRLRLSLLRRATAHSSLIRRGFVQPGFTLPAPTQCLAPGRYTTIHLDTNHTGHHFRCLRKQN